MQENGSRQRGSVRLELVGPVFVAVEDWRRSHAEIPSRSEAVRLLLALALSARPTARHRNRAAAPDYELNAGIRDRMSDSPT
jgi:hypothetical protein